MMDMVPLATEFENQRQLLEGLADFLPSESKGLQQVPSAALGSLAQPEVQVIFYLCPVTGDIPVLKGCKRSPNVLQPRLASSFYETAFRTRKSFLRASSHSPPLFYPLSIRLSLQKALESTTLGLECGRGWEGAGLRAGPRAGPDGRPRPRQPCSAPKPHPGLRSLQHSPQEGKAILPAQLGPL